MLLYVVLTKEKKVARMRGGLEKETSSLGYTSLKSERSCWLTSCSSKIWLERQSNQEEVFSECTGSGCPPESKDK